MRRTGGSGRKEADGVGGRGGRTRAEKRTGGQANEFKGRDMQTSGRRRARWTDEHTGADDGGWIPKG